MRQYAGIAEIVMLGSQLSCGALASCRPTCRQIPPTP